MEEDCRTKKNGGPPQNPEAQGLWHTGNGSFLCPHCRNAALHRSDELCPHDPTRFAAMGCSGPTQPPQKFQEQPHQSPDPSVPNATGYNPGTATLFQGQWANTTCAHCGTYGHPASSCPILLNDKPRQSHHWVPPQPAQHSFTYNPYQNPLINAADANEAYGWGKEMGMPRNGYIFNDATNPGSVMPIDKDGDVIMDFSEHFDAYVHHEHARFSPQGNNGMVDNRVI